jgi:TonB family protein
MQTRTLIALFFLLASGFAQNTPKPTNAAGTHYPVLTHAEMPMYPRVALAAHIKGTVTIQVTVEHGSVTNAQVQSSDSPFLSNPAVENVKTWQFEPNADTKFVVKYVYRIEGKETLALENPKIELELPRLVKVTARPTKPTCSDCRAQSRSGENTDTVDPATGNLRVTVPLVATTKPSH